MRTRRPFRGGLMVLAAAVCLAGPVSAQDPSAAAVGAASNEMAYVRENDAAMNKMMADMHVTPTGDVDVDFVAMMIPHHQGAIDMAEAYLRHGRNEELRRMAQEIIVEQQQEIAAMRLALGQPLPPAGPVPTQPGAAPPAPASTSHDHPAAVTHDKP